MRYALILGATSDIGAALAGAFASHGFGLLLAARRPEALASLVSDVQIRHGVEALPVAFDALDYASHEAFYRALPHPPEVVICLFGYLGDQQQAQRDFAEAQRIIETNFTGAVSILNIVANDFERRGTGSIIGVSSVAGDRGRASNYYYGSAKAALTTYLSGLRNRLAGSNVHVLTVRPGFVATRMTQGMKLPPLLTATPERVARDVYRAYTQRKDAIYTIWPWRLIMLAIRAIPEPLFKRLSL